jgi:hypothetical protein
MPAVLAHHFPLVNLSALLATIVMADDLRALPPGGTFFLTLGAERRVPD